MINYELKPTFDNLKKSILQDSVGRNKSIATFIELLDEIDSNIAIALDDSWGNGKTFFVKQTQMVLQSLDSSDENLTEVREYMKKCLKHDTLRNYFPVYYDAWSNDNDTDPVLSIIFEMLKSIKDLEEYAVRDKNWWDTIKKGFEVAVTAFGGPRIGDFLNSVEGTDLLAEIKKSKEADQVLNELFDTLLEKQPEGTWIIFFIDELDRCCPNFAVRLLERIKHHFLHKRVIFVLSVNMSELQHTIKRHYGNDFNADKYLRRFFDFTIPLPPADMTKYYQTINFDDGTARYYTASLVMKRYNFSLREITRYLQYLKVAVPEKYNTSFNPRYGFYIEVLVPFLIGLSIHASKAYNDFLNGDDMNCFLEIMQDSRSDWLCKIFLDVNETFERRKQSQSTLVSLAEKFKPAYECIFGKHYSLQSVRVAGDTIDSSDKNTIMEILAFMKASQNLKGKNHGID